MTTTLMRNPLEESSRTAKTTDPCILVIFGATGDLTGRKLVPAIYNLAQDGQLPVHFACVGFARREKSHEVFREEMLTAINKFSRIKPVDQQLWKTLNEQIFYHRSEFDRDEGYEQLASFLKELDQKLGTKGNRVFYLSTQPSYFPIIIEKLHQHGLIYQANTSSDPWSRVIIEKPFGHDFTSATALQTHIKQYLSENQVYRIDHYLGKETVQNLLVFRFGNPIFEALWNHHYIDHIQITVSEEIGIGTRGRFWEEAGMLRDIVQNHMMQLMAIVAMEPPVNLTANPIRNEKVKVLEAIRPINNCETEVVRGQYGPGYVNGEEVKGYRQEENVAQNSNIETYVALKLHVNNWRWSGVPFYLRAGKRLPKRATEIAVTFKAAPSFLFGNDQKKNDPNVLVIRIQPNEGISLKTNCKVPGLSSSLQPVKMDFQYGSYFGFTSPEAYERLICDCILGDNTLFARDDEVLSSWKLLTPILERWQEIPQTNFPNYSAGTWGPETADRMLLNDGRRWRLL